MYNKTKERLSKTVNTYRYHEIYLNHFFGTKKNIEHPGIVH